jgi:hypothetical protein
METGPARVAASSYTQQTFYQRHPVLFWQGVSTLLGLALLASLWLRH